MLYLIYAQDVPNSLENRLAVRPAHLARLQARQVCRTHRQTIFQRVGDVLRVDQIKHVSPLKSWL